MTTPRTRGVRAANSLLDRAVGRPPAVDHDGGDRADDARRVTLEILGYPPE